jgi:hypothetical protein
VINVKEKEDKMLNNVQDVKEQDINKSLSNLDLVCLQKQQLHVMIVMLKEQFFNKKIDVQIAKVRE